MFRRVIVDKKARLKAFLHQQSYVTMQLAGRNYSPEQAGIYIIVKTDHF